MSQSATEERVEAVIISGPRKGEFINVNSQAEPELSAEEEAMLNFVVQAAKRMSESAKALSNSVDLLLHEVCEVNKRLHGSTGSSQ
ncbi:MAG: hypothetical protein JO316_04885 [Abitibacteriaceae bacterium]|nr:hypothetical protein [Abditibacteriaceae bacterium]